MIPIKNYNNLRLREYYFSIDTNFFEAAFIAGIKTTKKIKFNPMKIYVHIFLCCITILLTALKVKSQDIHFSQFFEAPLLRNPALAGLFAGDIRLQSVYKNQWQSISVPYQTVSLNGEYKLPFKKSEDFLTIGGQILYDKAGTINLTATHILPAINYHKSLSDVRSMYLSLGFIGGIVQRRLDRSKITTNSQFDGTNFNGAIPDGETFAKSGYTYFDGTAGMSFNTQIGNNVNDNIYFGTAYHHFNKAPKISFYGTTNLEMTPKWVYSAGIRKTTSEFTYITVEADYSKQGPFTELIGSMICSYKLEEAEESGYLIHGGAVLRWNDAFIPVVKIEVKPIAISLSYDINISHLATATTGRGGFELGISYQKYINMDNTSKEAVRCPRF